MTKEMLKQIANADYDSILDDAYNLLKERHWDVTKNGIEFNLQANLEEKKDKILDMVKSPFYNGNLQLVMPVTISRTADRREIINLLRKLRDMITNHEDLHIDLSGKKADDYLVPAKKIISTDEVQSFGYNTTILDIVSKFDKTLNSFDKSKKIASIKNGLSEIEYSHDLSRISSSVAERLNDFLHLEKKKIIEGQKTSKIVNRLLSMCDNSDVYNKVFTTLSDLLNPHDVSMYYVVSLNFLDYLRMSDGHSWASCHTTDKDNTRNSSGDHYSGAYCQGTLAYANDRVSYVTYLILTDGADVKHPERSDKIYREMYHVDENYEQIIQGRVYPQGNDGNTNIYELIFDKFMTIMKFDKDDFNHIGRSKYEADTHSGGAQYPDYKRYDDCQYYIKKGAKKKTIYIGTSAYSCKDGNELDTGDQDTIV